MIGLTSFLSAARFALRCQPHDPVRPALAFLTGVGGTQRLPVTKWMPTWTSASRECSLRRHTGARDERPDGIVELNPVDSNRCCGV